MKEIDFTQANYEQWQESAVKALKGKPFESLITKTIEGISFEPIYTQDQLVEKLDGKLAEQVSTIRSLKTGEECLAAQQIFADSPESLLQGVKEALAKGNDIINIDSRVNFAWDEKTLKELSVLFTENSFKLNLQNNQDALLQVFNYIKEEQKEVVRGFISCTDTIILKGFPHVRTINANVLEAHYEGAHAVQELAVALLQAAEYMETEEDIEAFAKKFFVTFAVDTQFFVEIAKLRAFRVLWKAFTSAYNTEKNLPITIVTETSLRSFSKLDVYVNLLRTGNEAFTAILGGADVCTVHPHDVLSAPNDKSIRIARNIQLVVKEETHVEHIIDPSGGSYFIETLTAELVKDAWALFNELQEAGGYNTVKASGQLNTLLKETMDQRMKEVETRKKSLIGTNIYANPADEIDECNNPLFADYNRLAKPFEELCLNYAKNQPKVALLTIGQLKQFKPRADFVSGFFATAGIVPEKSPEIQSVGEAKSWLSATDAKFVVVCGQDDAMKEYIPTLLESKPAQISLDVAGKFKEEQDEWTKAGLNGFIYTGQNIIEKLTSLAANVQEVQR
ncbi:methylmalonyl-CoA mutase family protein [Viridibacillus sp. NPDC096237]|uniref:methylmalonyl-CoA mutase family protein n=1 Tax=Viridibacillus sp. NPDC096237 TaxID=3390721 RepID=UPI003CFF7DB8